MNKKGVTAGWAVALFVFACWSIQLGFRSDMAPEATIPAWNTYMHPVERSDELSALLQSPLVRSQLIAAGMKESSFEGGRLLDAVRMLDDGAVEASVCARLRMAGGASDAWVYAARFKASARLMHWRVLLSRMDGVSVIGRHNGWPIWQLQEESTNFFFAFADGMFFASMGKRPDGVTDVLDQFDGLIP